MLALLALLALPLTHGLPTENGPSRLRGKPIQPSNGNIFHLVAHNIPTAISLPLQISENMIYIGENPHPQLPYTTLTLLHADSSQLTAFASYPPEFLYFDPATSPRPQFGLEHRDMIPNNAIQSGFEFVDEQLMIHNASTPGMQVDFWASPVYKQKDGKGVEGGREEEVKTWALTWNSKGYKKEDGFALTLRIGGG